MTDVLSVVAGLLLLAVIAFLAGDECWPGARGVRVGGMLVGGC